MLVENEYYLIALLERLVLALPGRIIDNEEFLEGIRGYASSIQSAAEIHGDLRAQSQARTGEMPQHVQEGDAQVLDNKNEESSLPQSKVKSNRVRGLKLQTDPKEK